MGYYKQQEVAQQSDVDRMVAWYHSEAKNTPKYLYDWLMARDERIWSAIEAWETAPVPPKPATEHVALQPVQITRRQALWLERNQPAVSLSKVEYKTALVVLLGVCALVLGAFVAAVVVL